LEKGVFKNHAFTPVNSGPPLVWIEVGRIVGDMETASIVLTDPVHRLQLAA
jgi:hypothetical protein